MERPAKRAKLLDDSDYSENGEEADVDDFETQNPEVVLDVNLDFAKRFEHNKKREELQRLQDKYGKDSIKVNGRDGSTGASSDADGSESELEDEDDDGYLARGKLDDEVNATLKAIRNKDPRVYDKSSKFYTEDNGDEVEVEQHDENKKDEPLYLRDYHRKNLLGEVQDEEAVVGVQSYADEQSALKNDLLEQMHKIHNGSEDGSEESDEEEFLTKKQKPTKAKEPVEIISEVDIKLADKDPEGYLEKFMSTRGWVAAESSRFQPFDEDEDSDDARADSFEAAYNMRFEDPSKTNEKLVTHSRQAAASYSVRREDLKGKKKRRHAAKDAKGAERQEQEQEMSRLRHLKIEQAQEKLEKFKQAAGLKDKDISVEDWSKFLESGFEAEKWQNEMGKRFDDKYYAEVDGYDEEGTEKGERKRKLKKPVWDDDIDINDIVPGFEEEEAKQQGAIALSDTEEASIEAASSRKEAEELRSEQRRRARTERRKIEAMVDQDVLLESLPSKSKSRTEPLAPFRYRDTSPTSFGLTAREILMAEDSQLNEFIGLKKMASFRDAEKKRKDRKRLGKKGRLRQWRKDTFGDEDGPRLSLQDFLSRGSDAPLHVERSGEQADKNASEMSGEKKKNNKRKRSRKKKNDASAMQVSDGVSLE